MGTEAGEAGAVGADLERRRFSRSDVGAPDGNGMPPLSETVAGEVQELLDASEAAARAIRDHAVAEAEALRDALRSEAEDTRREIATRAQHEIAAVVGESLRRLTDKAAKVDASLKELRAEANRLASDLHGLGAGMTPRELPPSEQPMADEERRGRLIALTMAINGASRGETARYLEENLNLRDVEALLDATYG